MIFLYSQKCDICDKEFFPKGKWGYEFYTKDNKKKMFCSFKCLKLGKERYPRRREERISDEVKRKM